MNNQLTSGKTDFELTQQELCDANSRLARTLLELKELRKVSAEQLIKLEELELLVTQLQERNIQLVEKSDRDTLDRQSVIESLQNTIWELTAEITGYKQSKTFKLVSKLQSLIKRTRR